MTKEKDLHKVFAQHVELADFFAGFVIKPADIATQQPELTLEQIAAEVSRCTACGLSKTRNHTVAGQGNSRARLVFVGEAPGADEDAQGLPFVGRAGKLLTDIIKAMGLSRDDVFICNVLKCRPPGNRDPRPEEIISCMGYLKAQLAIIKPQIIVALGAHAARTLLDSQQAIGKLRGRFHDFYYASDYPPVKLMPTYHPAYLLRNYSPDNRRRVWEDMQKVMAELSLPLPQKHT